MLKKFAYLLLALPMVLLSACSDDDDNLPKFEVQVDFAEGATIDGGTITVEQGQPLTITSVKPVNYDAKAIAFGLMTYQLDYVVIGRTDISPYGMEFDTSTFPVGTHVLSMIFPVFAVDYSVCQAVVTYTVVITEPTGSDDAGNVTPQAGPGGTSVVGPKITA